MYVKIHFLDAINAILPAMQYRPHDSSPSSFNILSGEKASLSRLADCILNILRLDDHQSSPNDMIRPTLSDSAAKYLNFTPQTDTKHGITKLVSWYMQQQQFHKKHEEVFNSCNNESYCYRDQYLLPCASECSYSSMCEATGFDEAISISQRLTQNCPYVLYTSSFGPNVKAIDIKAPSSSHDDKDKEFCKIAFVSKNSELIRNNQGKNVHKGWNLIPIDWENGTARFQDKKWLPKLSPKNLFHQNVHYAIYLQDDLSKTPSLDDMLFIISLMTWKRQDFNGNIQQFKEAMILLSALEKNSTPLRKGQIDRSHRSAQQSESSPKVMTMSEAREKILEYRGINHPKGKQDLQKRIIKSQQTTILLNRCEFSTSCQSNMYKYALRHWVQTKWVVHDLHSFDAKEFRCDWYREHIKLNDDFDEFSFAHVMAIKEIEHFLSLDDEENYDDETDTRAKMLERVLNGDLERWISLGTKQDNHHEKKKLYVHIVDTEKLVDGRMRWNQERLIQKVKASK